MKAPNCYLVVVLPFNFKSHNIVFLLHCKTEKNVINLSPRKQPLALPVYCSPVPSQTVQCRSNQTGGQEHPPPTCQPCLPSSAALISAVQMSPCVQHWSPASPLYRCTALTCSVPVRPNHRSAELTMFILSFLFSLCCVYVSSI